MAKLNSFSPACGFMFMLLFGTTMFGAKLLLEKFSGHDKLQV